MAFRIGEHPLVFFVTFVLPALLFVLGIVYHANAFLFILCGSWTGIAFMILYLPVEAESEQ
ncbi:MAG: hypothetical protein OEM29_08490 [Thermoplasmata archaeon]|nr:hypothetical protein [Thermoplasmata archaeon]